MEIFLVHVYFVNIPVKPVHQKKIAYPAMIMISTELNILIVPVLKDTILIIIKLVNNVPNSTVKNVILMENV